MTQYESIFSAASQLPVDQRLRLIDDLAATVPDDRPPSLSLEWLSEIERRWKEIESGKVTTVPWDAVRDEVLGRIGNDRSD